jgi:outer membrane receptor protein involved in Fe transport
MLPFRLAQGLSPVLIRMLMASYAVAAAPGAAAEAVNDQLFSLPIEQLMQFEVEGASKYAQKISDAPAVVSIVTAEDIRSFGYQTLADILNSIRGLYVSSDRNYSYLGVRGFSTPGDYGTRVLMLVDGVRYNDAIYGQTPIGTDFSIDIDLIERVEFIAGPTSSVYGSNAVFGVINVITKSGADFRGGNLAASAGSYGTGKIRASMGEVTDSGASWLISATRYNQSGDDLYFPEFDTPAQNHGVADNLDYDRSTTLFAKYKQQDFTVTATHGERTKGIPTASFGQSFNTGGAQTIDERTNLGFEYRHAVTALLNVTGRLYGGRYRYRGDYLLDDLDNRDTALAHWLGGEGQLVATSFQGHKIIAGFEYKYAPRIEQQNFDLQPRAVYLNDRRSENVFGVYAQDEIQLGKHWLLDLGGRFDHLSSIDWVASPRAGLIYQPSPATSIKLLYGTAYRSPNAYELYYYRAYYQAQDANYAFGEDLKAERIQSREWVLEHAFSAQQRLSLSLFDNEVTDLIALQATSDEVLYFVNDTAAHTRGVELEWQINSAAGTRLKASYSLQQTHDADGALVNAPRNVIKLNLSGPLPIDKTSYGVALRGLSARNTLACEAPGYGVVDFTLRSLLTKQWEISANLYNVFDHRYYDPGSAEHLQDVLQQNGRSFRIKLDYWL